MATKGVQHESGSSRAGIDRSGWAGPRAFPPYDIYATRDPVREAKKTEANDSGSRKRLAELAQDKDYDIRERVGRNRHTSPDTLDKLSSDEKPQVRGAVAENVSTPDTALARLATDSIFWVRENVARNTSASHETLAKLAEDKTTDYLVAENSSASKETLLKLAKGERVIFTWVGEHLAGNRSAPPEAIAEVVAKAAAYKEPYSDYGPEGYEKFVMSNRVRTIMSNAAENTATSPETLTAIAEWSVKNWSKEVAMPVLQNPSTPNDVLTYLAEHHMRSDVRDAAKRAIGERGLANLP